MSPLRRRLKDLYFTGHHRRVRRRSDHPTRHARLMLEEAARRRPGGDGRFTGHGNRPGATDAKGWALLAAKP